MGCVASGKIKICTSRFCFLISYGIALVVILPKMIYWIREKDKGKFCFYWFFLGPLGVGRET